MRARGYYPASDTSQDRRLQYWYPNHTVKELLEGPHYIWLCTVKGPRSFHYINQSTHMCPRLTLSVRKVH